MAWIGKCVAIDDFHRITVDVCALSHWVHPWVGAAQHSIFPFAKVNFRVNLRCSALLKICIMEPQVLADELENLWLMLQPTGSTSIQFEVHTILQRL